MRTVQSCWTLLDTQRQNTVVGIKRIQQLTSLEDPSSSQDVPRVVLTTLVGAPAMLALCLRAKC